MGEPIALLVADEDRLVGEALALALARCESTKALDEHPRTGAELSRVVREAHPDVALIGDPLLDMSGPAAVRAALAADPALKVLLMAHECRPEHVREAMDVGAVGFLPKSLNVPTVSEAVRCAYAGEYPVFEADLNRLLDLLEGRGERKSQMAERLASLSPRQFEILRLMGSGLTAQQMGTHTGLKEATVRTHIQQVLGKLDVRSQVEAVAVARDLGALR